MVLTAVSPAAKALAMSAFRRTRLGDVLRLRCFTIISFPGRPREALSYCSEMQLERCFVRSPRPDDSTGDGPRTILEGVRPARSQMKGNRGPTASPQTREDYLRLSFVFLPDPSPRQRAIPRRSTQIHFVPRDEDLMRAISRQSG